jgi:hypothetical protein
LVGALLREKVKAASPLALGRRLEAGDHTLLILLQKAEPA